MTGRSVTAYPLCWPVGWPRAKHRRSARFGEISIAQAIRGLLLELRRLGAPDNADLVISSQVELRQDGLPYSNRRPPADPGVAVYFGLEGDRGYQRHVLACDAWTSVEHNLRAIALHIEAMRGMERWGVGSLERAFTGYAALPVPGTGWRDVLGEARTVDEVQAAFRSRALAAHPDRGGTPEAFHRLTEARDAALRDLAMATSCNGAPA